MPRTGQLRHEEVCEKVMSVEKRGRSDHVIVTRSKPFKPSLRSMARCGMKNAVSAVMARPIPVARGS